MYCLQKKSHTVKDSVMLDDDMLNVLRHRPVFCSIQCPHFHFAEVYVIKNRIQSQKVNTDISRIKVLMTCILPFDEGE